MNIVACVKQVPDTWADKKLLPDTMTLDRESADGVMNELDEYAVEEALRIKEAHGGSVTIVTMGPGKSLQTVRKALSMGADAALQVTDDALLGSCAMATSRVLAAAIGTLEADLVIFGSETTDAGTGVVPALVAERLGRPQLTLANKVEVDGTTIRVNRLTDTGYDVVEAQLPAVVSVVEKTNEPRYPSFKGIMAAKSKPLTTMSLADLGIDAAEVGAAGASTAVRDATQRPPRSGGEIVTDSGDGAAKLAEFLHTRKYL
ncbi:MAG: electron transfer flavoprotein beta subunit [Frankiaceae bacterium]|nr:electron transfer flavoprotein beta subunit [Frankiaceae bacterium]